MAYSGHTRVHGLKFQAVTVPDGLIALMYGCVAGSRHDALMLDVSGLCHQLEELMAPDTPLFSLCGDPAYPQSRWSFGGYRNPNAGSEHSPNDACLISSADSRSSAFLFSFALLSCRFKRKVSS